MTIFAIIPFFLFLVVIGTAIAERINVPYPLILVIAGLIVSFIPGIPNWHPPSHIVLSLFLPPILFAAARLISFQDIRKNITKIISLAFLLVIASTLAIAWLLNWLIPNLPFSSALVLGAIISPTDTFASTSILHRLNIRSSLIHSLEIESLFNDATSIILYKTSLLFVFMETIHLSNIGERLLLANLGGIAIGLVFSYFTSLIIKALLTDSENELPIIMGIILAYVSYLFANHLGMSGVLAVVAAGLFHKRTERAIQAKTRLSEKAVWDTLIFFLNGLIFFIIGLQFQTYLEKVNYLSIKQLTFFSTITIVILITTRLIWITLTHYLVRFVKLYKKKPQNTTNWKDILIASWSGMRGMVSLALAIALPLFISDNMLFPARELIIFLTIITILFTLLVQGLSLPCLLKLLQLQKQNSISIKKSTQIYQKLTKKAIQRISRLETTQHICSANAKKLVDNYYTNRLLQFKLTYETDCDTHEVGHEAEKLLKKILNYERTLLHQMRKKNKISEETYIRIRTKIDRDEVGFSSYK